MPFPEYERVVYQKNPLNEVVFRANYPKLLMIETEVPASFQKRVIGDYPIYEQRNVLQIVLGTGTERLTSPTCQRCQRGSSGRRGQSTRTKSGILNFAKTAITKVAHVRP